MEREFLFKIAQSWDVCNQGLKYILEVDVEASTDQECQFGENKTGWKEK